MSKRTPFSSKALTWLAIALIAIGAVSAWFVLQNSQPALVLPGEVQAKEFRNGSRFGGRIRRIWVKEGQTVKAGQMLVEFEDADLKAKIVDARATLNQALIRERMLARGADVNALRQANAAVNQAQANVQMVNAGARPEELAQVRSKVTVAETQYKEANLAAKNAQSLLESGIISQQKYNTLVETAQSAKSNLEAAQAAYHMAHTGGRPEERRIASAQLAAARAQAWDPLESTCRHASLSIL